MADNGEILRRAIDAFNRHDFDEALRDAAPDAVMDWSHSLGPDVGVYVGHDAICRFWTGMTEVFERFTSVADEFIAHDEYVVIPNTGVMTGRGGVDVAAHSASVASFREGRVVRWTMYQDTAEALRAVGLDE